MGLSRWAGDLQFKRQAHDLVPRAAPRRVGVTLGAAVGRVKESDVYK